jgi:hypothetical protein
MALQWTLHCQNAISELGERERERDRKREEEIEREREREIERR